jgi:hypothetical protein
MVSKKRSMKRGHKIARKVMKKGGEGSQDTPVIPINNNGNALYMWCCDNTTGVCRKKDDNSIACGDNDSKYECNTDTVDASEVKEKCTKSIFSEKIEPLKTALNQYIPPVAKDAAKDALNVLANRYLGRNLMPKGGNASNRIGRGKNSKRLKSNKNRRTIKRK